MHPNFAIAVAAALPMATAGVIRVPSDEPVSQAVDVVVFPNKCEEARPSPHVLYNLKKPDLSEWEGHEDKIPYFKKYDPELLLKFVDDFCEGKVKRGMGSCCQCDDEDDCESICVSEDDCKAICETADTPEKTDAIEETGVDKEVVTEDKTCKTCKTPSYQAAHDGTDFTAKDILHSIDDKWAELKKPKNDKRGVPISGDDVLRWSQGKGKDYQAKRPELFKNIAAETQAKRDETSGKKGGVHITVDDVMSWAQGNDKEYKAKCPEIFENITAVLPNNKRSNEVDNSDQARLRQTFQSVLERSKAALEFVEKVDPDREDGIKTVLASLIATLDPLRPGMENPAALIARIIEANGVAHEKRDGTGELSDVQLDIPSLMEIFEDLWLTVRMAKEELHRLHGSQDAEATTSAADLESFIDHCEPIVNSLNDLADIFDTIVDQLTDKEEQKPVTHVEPDSFAAEGVLATLVRRGDWSNNPMFSVKSSPNREQPHRVAEGSLEKLLKDPHFHQ